MFQIGDSLREARTRQGFTPTDVHKAIRIRERYLTALEEERWDMLPGEAYTKGFLRTYSEHLGLKSQLYIDEYNARIAGNEDDPVSFVAHPTVEERSLKRGILVALAAVLVVGSAVAGLAAWRLSGSSAPPQSTPPPATTPRTSTLKATVVPTTPALTSISAARGRCWVLVRSGGPNGRVLFEGVLEQGQAKQFRFTSRLWVRMGRPNALDITVAGKAVAGLPGSPSNLVLTRAGAQAA